MKRLLFIVGWSFALVCFADDTRNINPQVEGDESTLDSVRGATEVNSYLTKQARDHYSACAALCTIEIIQAECLTDCYHSSRSVPTNTKAPVIADGGKSSVDEKASAGRAISPGPRQIVDDELRTTRYPSDPEIKAVDSVLDDPFEMISAKNNLKQTIGATTPLTTTPKIEALQIGKSISEMKIVSASTGDRGIAQVDRASAAMDSHESSEQGSNVALAQQVLMVSQAIALRTGNPTPVEDRAADQLLIWAEAQGDQARESRASANKNWEQCILLKGNYEVAKNPLPDSAWKNPITGSDSPCLSPKENEFIVTPEMAEQLESLGIGRLEFQGRAQAGDWKWIRTALGVGGAGEGLSEEDEAKAMQLAAGSTGTSRMPSSSHVNDESDSAPAAALTADQIFLSGAPQPPAPQPPDLTEMREAGVVSLQPPLNVFGFASRKFTNWQRSLRSPGVKRASSF